MTPGDEVLVLGGFRKGRGTLVSIDGGTCIVEIDGKRTRRAMSQLRPVSASGPGQAQGQAPTEAKLSAVPKAKRVRDEAYLAWLRKQPCCVTGYVGPEVEASHHNEQGHGAMAMKADDSRAIPLCNEVHAFFHQHGRFPGMTAEETRRRVEVEIRIHRHRWDIDSDDSLDQCCKKSLHEWHDGCCNYCGRFYL